MGRWQIGQRLGWGSIASALAISLVLGLPGLGQAQQIDFETRETFLADPLEDEPRDPLLPVLPIDRPLSPLEQLELAQKLDALSLEAAAELEFGDAEVAFEMWMREVRLRRILGYEAEIAAIDRVGEVAWSSGRTTEVRLLTFRLDEIQADLRSQAQLTDEILDLFATLYTRLRAQKQLIAVYQEQGTRALAAGNLITYQTTLEALGATHLQWFHFTEAAAVYEELLALPSLRPTTQQQEIYLKQLIYSYQQALQIDQAIEAQTRLLTFYEQQNMPELLPRLHLALAKNYRTQNQLDLASVHYQAAYGQAQTLRQFDDASQALWELSEIYRNLDRLDDTLYLYGLLLRVEQQSYNAYGIMQVFDQLGQVYRLQGNRTQALDAFREGYIVAQQINHRQDYFLEQMRLLQTESEP